MLTLGQGEAIVEKINNQDMPKDPEEILAQYTPSQLTSIARGLGRTTTIGRQPNGLPITREGEVVRAMMAQNRRTASPPELPAA